MPKLKKKYFCIQNKFGKLYYQNYLSLLTLSITGVDLSKILGGQTKILGEKGGISDKYMGNSQLLGDMCLGCPKVYAYVINHDYDNEILP